MSLQGSDLVTAAQALIFVQEALQRGTQDDLDAVAKLVGVAQAGIAMANRPHPEPGPPLSGGCWDYLPPEIHSRIFELCTPKLTIDSRGDDNPSLYPVVLSLVSRRWQQVALATPRIWSSITLVASRKRPFPIKRAKLWLTRARSLPLSFYLWISTCDGEYGAADVISMIIINLTQCEHFDVCTDPIYIGTILSSLQGPAPILSQFCLSFFPWMHSPELVPLHPDTETLATSIFAHQSPSLISAHLPFMRLEWPLPARVNLTTLTIPHAGATTIPALLSIFESSPNLTKLAIRQFHLSIQDYLSYKHIAPVVHAAIEELEINCTAHDAVALLDKLRLPQLRILRIGRNRPNDPLNVTPWPCGGDRDSPVRLFPLIDTFEVDGVLHRMALHDLLSRMGNLRKLVFSDTESIKSMRHLLGRPDGSLTLLCPLLADLALRSTPSKPMDLEELKELFTVLVKNRPNLTRLAYPAFSTFDKVILRNIKRGGLLVEPEEYDIRNNGRLNE